MYSIGIIDDVQDERNDIQVSIYENFPAGVQPSFKEYEIKGKTKNALFNEIREDIIEKRIGMLIVDFKLDTEADIIEGWEIIEFMNDETPNFPVVIMTNVPDDSKKSDSTDADKVYSKKIFLNPELPETKELVNNIYLNMGRYQKHRDELEGKLEIEVDKYIGGDTSDEVVSAIVEIEDELSRYKQIYQSAIDKSIDIQELEQVVSLLEKIEGLGGV